MGGRLWEMLKAMTYRDGFWFLFGAVIGCEVVTIVTYLFGKWNGGGG